MGENVLETPENLAHLSGNHHPSPSEPLDINSATVNLTNPHGRAVPLESRAEPFRTASQRIPSVDSKFLGDYELLEIVGRGGMGIVYKARHRTLNRIVALKVIGQDRMLSLEMVQRFHREAAAVAKLDHPHIVPIYEIGEVNGQQFYSMAFIEGISLAQLVAVSPLAPRRAAEIMQPVAAAIAHAHAQGVVHRDLKPDNILLDLTQPTDGKGRPRVTDFGIAKSSDTDSRLTMAGEVIGTPSYMSPEQAQGNSHEVGPLSDVYALGATLYCLLTGHPPFQAATPLDTLKHVMEREPVSPRGLNPVVDRDLDTICLKCLEKTPQRRYASATALAEDLQRFLEKRPILARPVSRFGKAARWCRRNPYLAGMLAILVTVFLTAFTLVSWSYWRAEEALHQQAAQRAAANEARDDARRHEQAERWERYRANMIAVSSAFQTHNISVARQGIETAPAVHHNWEWRHFRHQLDQSRQVLTSPEAGVGALRFAGNHHLVAFDDGLHVLDLATGKRLRTFKDFHKWAWVVDPTGRYLAYSTKENAIVLWDIKADRKHAVLHGCDGPIFTCAFDATCDTVAACTNDFQAVAWDTATGKRACSWSFADGPAGLIGSEISSRQLVATRLKDNSVCVWDLKTGRKQYVLKGHREHAVRAEFNRQGSRIVTAEGYPSNVMRMWNAQSGEPIAVLRGHTNLAQDMRFSPDGKLLASCSYDQTIRLWDGMTGAPIATLRGHTGRVLAIAFSLDSTRLVSGSQDHSVRLWDATTGGLIAVLHGHANDVNSVAFSPDGATIASGSSDRTTRLWDARLAERNGVLRGHTSFVYGVAFHPDGERLVSAGWDSTIRVWNATSGQETAVWHNPVKTTINSISIDPSGKLLASLGRDNAVRLWDMATGKHLHHWTIFSDHWQEGRVKFSPGGNLLAAGSRDGSVHVWDVHSRDTWSVLRGHRENVFAVAFSPDGRRLASAGADLDGSIRIWDVAKKEQVRLLPGHVDEIFALAFSPDGKVLASGSKDGTVRLWETTNWKPSAVLNHGTNVYGVAFTPDGTRLATSCADNSIRFWDVATGQEVAELRNHGSYVKTLAFSPDGSRLASASGDCTIRIWDTMSARERGRSDRKVTKTQVGPVPEP
jgi:WD40 repeat protein/serine/threonine protein kinase